VVKHEFGRVRSLAEAQHPPEIRTLPETIPPLHGRSGRSDGQAAAALGAPLADDGAAPGRPHAFAEPVAALAPAVVWLIRAFHDESTE